MKITKPNITINISERSVVFKNNVIITLNTETNKINAKYFQGQIDFNFIFKMLDMDNNCKNEIIKTDSTVAIAAPTNPKTFMKTKFNITLIINVIIV